VSYRGQLPAAASAVESIDRADGDTVTFGEVNETDLTTTQICGNVEDTDLQQPAKPRIAVESSDLQQTRKVLRQVGTTCL
jgi:hypothetical protein